MDPVADVLAGAIELGLDAVDDIGNLPRDDFFDVLEGTIIVGAIRDGCLDAEASDPGTYQQVGAGLGTGVWTGRIVRRGLLEFIRIFEFEVAVDFVGGDVVKTFLM